MKRNWNIFKAQKSDDKVIGSKQFKKNTMIGLAAILVIVLIVNILSSFLFLSADRLIRILSAIFPSSCRGRRERGSEVVFITKHNDSF